VEEAREALIDGLQFEPEDKVSSLRLIVGVGQLILQELNAFLKEIDATIASLG
jgi:hypothetical protein